MEFGDKIGVWDKFDVNLLYKEQIGWKALRIYQGFGINLTDLKSRLWCTSIYQTLETENLRAVWFSKDSKSEDLIPIILTWDTEDRARMVIEEYRSLGKPVIFEKKPYKGSILEGIDLKLGRI